MKSRRVIPRTVVALTALPLLLQSVFPQALPVETNRPERGLPSSADSWQRAGDPALVPHRVPGPVSRHLSGTLFGEMQTMTPDPAKTSPPAKGAAHPAGSAPAPVASSAAPTPQDPAPGDPAPAAAAPSTAAVPTATAAVGAAVPNTTASAAKAAPPAEPLIPKQGHMGPEVFTENVKMNPLIKRYFDIYTSPGGINWLKIVLKRAAPFRDYIASRIHHYHMPPELLYLPIVESTYNTYAVSQTGAAGLWQFMTNSVYPYGLHINEWLDERFDFWKATDASLEKLKYNYDQLGNWLLALAAYNVGLNYVQRVVRQTGIHNVWELGAKGYLPYETMIYIPKFLAIAAVCSYAGRYGLPISWQTTTQWTRIHLHQAVDLRILSRQAGINESLLLEGNAELRYYITPPGDSNYYLKVPKRDSKVVERVLKQQKSHLMRFYIYTIKSGDTLYNLSLYYGVPISMILQYNPTASAHYLQIGERLVIPGLKNVPPYTPGAAAKLQPKGPKITLHDPSGRFTGLYTVRPGDTLWGISRKYGITAAKLAEVNGITESTIIREGIVLHVPGPGALITQGGN